MGLNRLLYFLAALAFISLFAFYFTQREPLQMSEPTLIFENGSIETCFTMQENCTALVVGLIESAEYVEAALYDLNLAEISAALIQNKSDVLIDEDNYDGFGKNISSYGLMHNKFYVIHNASGGYYLITGSANPTFNDFYKNDNNIIVVGSPTLLNNYGLEFHEIKSGAKSEKTKLPRIIFNGFELENYFCPEDNCEEQVLEEIRSANSSVFFMTFSFTSDPIGELIVARRGELEVRGVFDKSQVAANKAYSEFHRMNDSGMNVKVESSSGKLHHKVFIIDNKTVITGSYNPSASGDSKNDENILIIHDESVAREYILEFERIWNEN